MLEVSVPNRTMFEKQVSRYRDVEIKVRYENDDPSDRARYLDWVKRHNEWVNKQAGGPEPLLDPLSK